MKGTAKSFLTLFIMLSIMVLLVFISSRKQASEAPKKIIPEITLTGLPINAEARYSRNYAQLIVVIQDKDRKTIMCRAGTLSTCFVMDAKVVIQSEIDDKDAEAISLRGYYERGNFFFTSVSANGYAIVDAVNN